MNNLFITLTTLAILSQIPHAWWAIANYNRIPIAWMARLQNAVFCSIISIGILAYVLIGKHEYAFGGAIVEVIINLYYYNNQFSGKGQSTLKDKIRKNWLAYFLAVLIPMTIFFFSLEIKLA